MQFRYHTSKYLFSQGMAHPLGVVQLSDGRTACGITLVAGG